MRLINQFRQIAHSTEFQSLGERILKDEFAQSVMDQLHKSTVHHLLMQHVPGQQSNLVGIQLCHRLGRQFTADRKNQIYLDFYPIPYLFINIYS